MKDKDFKEIINFIMSKSPDVNDLKRIESCVKYSREEMCDYVELLTINEDGGTYKKEFSKDQTKYLKEILDFFYIEDDNIEKEWEKILSDNPEADIEDYIEELTELEVGDLSSGYGIHNCSSYIFLHWNG